MATIHYGMALEVPSEGLDAEDLATFADALVDIAHLSGTSKTDVAVKIAPSEDVNDGVLFLEASWIV